MESASLIVSAVVAGLKVNGNDAAKSTIEDTHALFLSFLKKKVEGYESAQEALIDVEEKPNSTECQTKLREELVKLEVIKDEELLRLARVILKENEARARKFNIDIKNAEGVVIGDHAKVEQYFGSKVEIFQQILLISTVAVAPAPPPSFTGRRQLLEELKIALTNSMFGVPIALHGMGGIGKTATVLKLTTEMERDFPGGVFWGSLSDHEGDARPILHTWGMACGRDFPLNTPRKTLTDLIRGSLSGRRIEHGPLLAVIDDVRSDWLNAAKTLQEALPSNTPLLLTTRDETSAVALGANVQRLDVLTLDEGLFFLQRLAGKVVNIDLNEGRELLKLVGYLPLAIELAGKLLALQAHKPGFRLSEFVRSIERQTPITLTVPGDHELGAVFAVTYETLSADEQLLFRYLGIFSRTQLFVSHVAGVIEWPLAKTELVLDALVHLALLAWGRFKGSYDMHPLLHQYAVLLLKASGEESKVRERRMTYFSSIYGETTFYSVYHRAKIVAKIYDVFYLGSGKVAAKASYYLHGKELKLFKILERDELPNNARPQH